MSMSDREAYPGGENGGHRSSRHHSGHHSHHSGRHHSGSGSSRRRRARRRRRFWIRLAIGFAVFLAVGISTFFILKTTGKSSLKNRAATPAPVFTAEELSGAETVEEGILYRNGKKYRYNENIITILCMGIDTTSDAFLEGGEIRKGGQSDANFLLALDGANQKIRVIAIPRDTMTEIDFYDVYGKYYDSGEGHLALQYAYGGGGPKSCELMKKAVSNLMYQLPIHAYVSVNMKAIALLNDQVGGVTVTIADEYAASLDPAWNLGEAVTLTGQQAVDYVRQRDTNVDFSAQARLQRQKQYLLAFMGQALNAIRGDLTLPVGLYQSAADYMVTDLGVNEVVYLATEAVNYSFDENSFYVLEGESVKGSLYEEFYVDEAALQELILEIFYLEEE